MVFEVSNGGMCLFKDDFYYIFIDNFLVCCVFIYFWNNLCVN